MQAENDIQLSSLTSFGTGGPAEQQVGHIDTPDAQEQEDSDLQENQGSADIPQDFVAIGSDSGVETGFFSYVGVPADSQVLGDTLIIGFVQDLEFAPGGLHGGIRPEAGQHLV